MLELIGDALGSILGGGATGLIGTGITLFAEFKKQKLNFKHEAEMKALSMQQDKQNAEFELQGIRTRADAEIDISDAANFGKALDADRATYSKGETGVKGFVLGIVDFVRGMIRPAATIWFSYLAYRIYVDIDAKVKALPIEAEDVDKVLAMHQNVTLVLLYLTCTAVTYWFGTRIKTQQPITDMFKGAKR